MFTNKFLTANTEKLTRLARCFPHYVYEEIVEPIHQIEQESWKNIDAENTMLDFVFARAMKQFTKDNAEKYEHIYTKKFEIPQIQLFELLIKKFPMISMTQQLANTLICERLRGWKEAVLVDIGAGTGYQAREIVRRLGHEPLRQLQKVTIVAIEPFAEALEAAKQNFEEIAKEVPFEVNYILKNEFSENMSLQDWSVLLSGLGDNIVVNASFALHHIKSNRDRIKVFQNLRDISVRAIVLSEPNVDHYEPNYYQRFKNCLHLFSLIFEAIDELQLTDEEKNALKLFFSREVDDILGVHESDRVEKHYAVGQWLALLQEVGFIATKKDLNLYFDNYCSIEIHDSYYDFWSIRYKNEDVISVIMAEPLEVVLTDLFEKKANKYLVSISNSDFFNK
ncbi:GRAS family protein [Xanthocytophaga flava]|uniref:GRAS family protein n=1 Tax=Xanthocytophaga flava TaxID=3048013 RepID=UPI0028D5FE0D|nr:GRAS family protein [Xanthocytophaga flavus]MDJ1466367.1 transcriptional regulator [Xanthocytophaga flavus]